MKVALCNIGSPVYVPAGEYLDGFVIDSAQWARNGEHSLSSAFAHKQEANGMLEIVSVDGVPIMWGGCCSGH